MKTLIKTLVCLLFLLLAFGSLRAGVSFCSEPFCPKDSLASVLWGEDQPRFQRTYLSQSKNKIKGTANPKNGNQLVITRADFEEHLALDRMRTLTIIPVGTNVTMDVMGIDETGDQPQVWDMPDFNNFSPVSREIRHITPESSGFLDEYPETTHSFVQTTDGIYQMYELTDDDLFILGAITDLGNDEFEINDLFYTASPVPLEWGLEFEGMVTVEYTEDPEFDSTIIVTLAEVVAYGMLNTYDDGPVPAVKLHVKRSIADYHDGQIIDESSNNLITWYSKDGHYLMGWLESGAPMTGQTTFTHMQYHRLDRTVSTSDVPVQGITLNYFPNPVSAGDWLTITNTENIEFGVVRLYDMQGRIVRQMDLSDMGALRNFQVQLPGDLIAGLYTFQVFSPQGTPVGKGKLQIQ